MLYLLGFFALITVVVGIHELGHYLVARLFNVRVLRFSIGFGKPLLHRTDKHGTQWCLAPIPLGGYVKLYDLQDESCADLGFSKEHSLSHKPRYQVMLVMFAGPAANFLLAWLLLFVLQLGGVRGLPAEVNYIYPDSIAATAGIQPGDNIVQIDDSQVYIWQDVQQKVVRALAGSDEISFVIERDQVAQTVNISLPKLSDRSLVDLNREIGIRPYEGYLQPEIARIVPDEAAAQAGFLPGDEIVAINDQVINHWFEFRHQIVDNPGKTLQVILVREGKIENLELIPKQQETRQGAIGYVGVVPKADIDDFKEAIVTVQVTWFETLGRAGRQTWEQMYGFLGFLRHLLVGNLSTANLSGPVGIAEASGDRLKAGIYPFIYFIASVSIALGMANLLPLSVLDGGRILLCFVEIISRQKLSIKLVRVFDLIAILMVCSLMIFTLYNDVKWLLY